LLVCGLEYGFEVYNCIVTMLDLGSLSLRFFVCFF